MDFWPESTMMSGNKKQYFKNIKRHGHMGARESYDMPKYTKQ